MSDHDLRTHLMSTAARLFQKQGYAAISLRKIAAEAGVTTGSLYYYFTDKDQIVFEILESGHRRALFQVRQAVVALGPTATRAARLRAAIRAHLAVLFETDSFPAANIRIFAHVPPHLRIAVRAGRRAYEQYWSDLLASPDAAGRLRVEPRQLSRFLLSAANSTLDWRKPEGESLDEIAENLSRIFVDAGIGRPTPARKGGGTVPAVKRI